MIHSKEWHVEQAELLLERAEAFADEFDMTWPELRSKYDDLIVRSTAHATIARAMES